MDYAVNKLTNKVESADSALGGGYYLCPICQARVTHRAGPKRKKYFAHWPGFGSSQCENYVPGQHGHNGLGNAFSAQTMRRMDLRLKINRGGNRSAWYLELVLPSCRACEATVTVDVGGGIQQQINMRGMADGRRVTAELSVENFRIISFEGDPDRNFVEGVERECRGLPSLGAAVFTASGGSGALGFPRAHELRGAETYALLWAEPAIPEFPNELIPDKFQSRKGWNLALVTLPESPSSECVEWLQLFTGLSVSPPAPSITIVWPFWARNSSLNAVECIESTSLILAAHMMPVGHQDTGPSMLVLGGGNRLSAIGVDRSPALFALTPGDLSIFRVAKSESSETEKIFSRTFQSNAALDLPGVEMVFTNADGVRLVVPLTRHRCKEHVEAARSKKMKLEYLAMPPGTKGQFYAEQASTPIRLQLSSSDIPAPHNQRQSLLEPEIQATLIRYLINTSSYVDLDFGGFGRLRLMGTQVLRSSTPALTLNPAVRLRLRSFMSQLQVCAPIKVTTDDYSLVHAFSTIKPHPELIPNYRALAKDILACGFEMKFIGEGVLS
ncbi:hypothetical protein [Pseudomonas sp.]|uniref:competence protein CoiA family protein n=1 Tax=Pseudomonas sp. TaxID=306 RepID=UPI003D096CC2